MYQNIMVAVDDEAKHSLAVLDEAIRLAKMSQARLHITTVATLYELAFDDAVRHRDEMRLRQKIEDKARQMLAPLQARAEAAGLEVALHPIVSWGSGTEIAAALLAEAYRHRAELFVMGTHGRRGLAHLFLGSVAEAVIQTADIPVVILRAK